MTTVPNISSQHHASNSLGFLKNTIPLYRDEEGRRSPEIIRQTKQAKVNRQQHKHLVHMASTIGCEVILKPTSSYRTYCSSFKYLARGHHLQVALKRLVWRGGETYPVQSDPVELRSNALPSGLTGAHRETLWNPTAQNTMPSNFFFL